MKDEKPIINYLAIRNKTKQNNNNKTGQWDKFVLPPLPCRNTDEKNTGSKDDFRNTTKLD